ncbi:MAG: glutathione S-transferase family protein [Alphaproteobacteria bacterium]|nr:glutathione S-transferase family protein [Alphaproteobacteria bacterium]
MKLYYFETPNARKPCAVAKYLNSPVEFVRIDLGQGDQKQPAFLAINPNGKIPALEDGTIKLWEGHAIMAYLALKAGSDLWPRDPLDQIEVMKWLNWDTAHFSRHAGRLIFENYLKGAFGLGEPVQSEIDDAMEFYKLFAGVLNDHLKGRDYVVGDGLTIADFGVASFLPTADEAKLPLEGCSEVHRWHDSMMKMDAWRAPWPDATTIAAQ